MSMPIWTSPMTRVVLACAVAAASGCATTPEDFSRFDPRPAIPDAGACELLRADQCAYTLSTTAPPGIRELPPGICGGLTVGAQASGIQAARTPDAVLVVHRPGATLVAFRGTLPPGEADSEQVKQDWINDINAKPAGEPGLGKVHRGFQKSLNAVWRPLTRKLRDLQRRGDLGDLYLTGHSKGGAMAILAAARLARQGMMPAGVVTFATPRVGAEGFAEAYQGLRIPTVRYENQGDVIPHLPPTAEELALIRTLHIPLLNRLVAQADYGSEGDLRYITPDGRIVSGPSDGPAFDKARLDAFRHQAAFKPPSQIVRLLARSHSSGVARAGDPPDEHRYSRSVCGVGP